MFTGIGVGEEVRQGSTRVAHKRRRLICSTVKYMSIVCGNVFGFGNVAVMKKGAESGMLLN